MFPLIPFIVLENIEGSGKIALSAYAISTFFAWAPLLYKHKISCEVSDTEDQLMTGKCIRVTQGNHLSIIMRQIGTIETAITEKEETMITGIGEETDLNTIWNTRAHTTEDVR